MKRLFSVLPCLALCFLLCGCKGGAQEPGGQQANTSDFKNSHSYTESSLPAPMALSTAQYTDGESIYFCGMDISGRALLLERRPDRSTETESIIEYTLPEGTAFVYSCCMGDGNLAVIAGDSPLNSLTGTKTSVENPQDVYHLYLLEYNAEGRLLSTKALEESPFDEGISVRSLAYFEGNYYMLSQTRLIQTDRDGNVLDMITLDSGIFLSQMIVKDELLVLYFTGEGDNGSVLSKVGAGEGLRLEELFLIDSWQVMGMGSSGDGDILINDGGKIYRLFPDSGETQMLFDFYQATVAISDFSNIYPFGDGYLLTAFYQEKTVRLCPGVAETRTELILWSEMPHSDILKYVQGFNQQSSDFFITVLDSRDWTEGQLMGEIAAGGTVDIYHVFDDSMLNSFKAEQVFEDLIPYMEPGGSLTPECILPQLQKALEENGKLYLLPMDFSFETVVTYQNPPVDSSLSFARQEELLKEAGAEYTLFPVYRDAEGIWHFLSRLYTDSHVDIASASCDFETPLFQQILEYCSNPAANSGYGESRYRPSVYFIDSFPGPLRLEYFQSEYGDDLQLVSEFGSHFYLGTCFAMAKNSQNKEGALEFLSYVNRREPDNPRFTWPASTDLFQQLLEEYQTAGIYDENFALFVPLTSHTIEQLYKLLDNTSAISGDHEDLAAILDSEAERCFAGIISPEEAAAQIQSRVSIYMAEQYG